MGFLLFVRATFLGAISWRIPHSDRQITKPDLIMSIWRAVSSKVPIAIAMVALSWDLPAPGSRIIGLQSVSFEISRRWPRSRFSPISVSALDPLGVRGWWSIARVLLLTKITIQLYQHLLHQSLGIRGAGSLIGDKMCLWSSLLPSRVLFLFWTASRECATYTTSSTLRWS